MLGSSTAAGYGASENDSAWVWRYRAYLSAINPGWSVVNLAHAGYSSYQLQPTGFAHPSGRPRPDTTRNITRALSLRPSALIVNLPSNDAASNYSILEQMENYERIAAEAALAQVPLWVSTTQPRNFEDARLQNLITMRDWLRSRFVDRAMDFWDGLAAEDGSLLAPFNSGDGIHLNDAGHALLFDRVRAADLPDEIALGTWIAETAPAPLSPGLQIYPNPARFQTTVHFQNPEAGPLRFVVQDLLGRTVLRMRERYAHTGSVFARLDVASLPPGMYMLIVRSSAGSSLTRLVVTR